MSLRVDGCPDCAKVTIGDCGQHGPRFRLYGPGTPIVVASPEDRHADLVSRLSALVQQWRDKAAINASTNFLKDDLRFGSEVWAMARRECADELAALITPQDTQA
jgi:hypothetical protein